MNLEMFPEQIDAVGRMKNRCILSAEVGLGKSRTGLAYYFVRVLQGSLRINGKGEYKDPKKRTPLYIITTAKKRDSKDWEAEMLPFLLSTNPETSICHIKVVVDSWNNIKKYKDVRDSFFLFDEDKVTGDGVWVKTFLRIARFNQWVVLTATPGDQWSDYIPVFIANGFYRNRTDFNNQHAVWKNFGTFWKVTKYVNTKKLEKCRSAVLVEMHKDRKTIPHDEDVIVSYDARKYKLIMKSRWDPYDDCPVENVSKLCQLLRRVCGEDPSRIAATKQIIKLHDRSIIFYNYDYELTILKKIAEDMKIKYAEWNGHQHDELPKGDKWLYLVQYTAGAEGWNAVTTDTIIFYSLNYSYKIMTQAKGRINRINTKYIDLYFYEIHSQSPIDRGVIKALKAKKDFNERRFIEG